MGSFHAFTKAELAQQERDQQDPAWLEWAAGISDRAARLAADIPGMPADPWTVEGLAAVEQYALTAFEDQDATLALENRALAEAIWSYLIELHVQTTEGRARNVPENGEIAGLEFGPDGSDDYSALYLTPITLLTALFSRAKRAGFTTFWVPIYERHVADYKKWVAAGRPSRADWVKQQEGEWLQL